MKNLPNINYTINYDCDFAFPPGKLPYKDTDLEIRVIQKKQFIQGQDKFPDFKINEFAFNKCYHFTHLFKAGEVVLWVPLYVHILGVIGVSDRNGDYKIQTKDGEFEGFSPESLLCIDNFPPSAAIVHRIKRYTYSHKNAERFCSPASKQINSKRPLRVVIGRVNRNN